MKIAVDFDGTIVEHKFPLIGEEIPFAIDTLRMLQGDGHKIILWTSREGDRLAEAVEFCRSRGLEFFSVNSEYPDGAFTRAGRKIVADVYIDDRNLGGLPEWGEIYSMITGTSAASPSRNKKGPLQWIADKCRSSREKFGR